jgi:hypothetical protein
MFVASSKFPGEKAQNFYEKRQTEFQGMNAFYPSHIDNLNNRWKSSHVSRFNFIRSIKCSGYFVEEIPAEEFQTSNADDKWFIVIKLVFNTKELIMAIPWTDNYKDSKGSVMHGSIAFFAREKFGIDELHNLFRKVLYRYF